MLKTLNILCVILGLVFLSAPASASTVNFDNIPLTYNFTSLPIDGDGFVFTTNTFQGIANVSGYGASNGSNYLAYFTAGSGKLTLSTSSHTPFNLVSIDLGGWVNFGSNSQTLTLIGYQADGGLVSSLLTLLPSSFETYSLANFSNLTSVELGSLARGYVAVDNLQLTAVSAVPEPGISTMFCVGAGIIMLAGLLTRNRKSSLP